jgi:hypothetical protein
MRTLSLTLVLLAITGCASRGPISRPPVTRTVDVQERHRVTEKLAELLTAEKIGIASRDAAKGLIVTDSFDVPVEYCDCGKNLLGAEYPGKRRGMMRLEISGGKGTAITIHFRPLLRITANDMLVQCSSSGLLEEKLLTALERELGKTSVH